MQGYVAGKAADRARRDMSKWWNKPAYTFLPGGRILSALSLVLWFVLAFAAAYTFLEVVQQQEAGKFTFAAVALGAVLISTLDALSSPRPSMLPTVLRWLVRLFAGVVGGGALGFLWLLSYESGRATRSPENLAIEIGLMVACGLVLVAAWPGRRKVMLLLTVAGMAASYALGEAYTR